MARFRALSRAVMILSSGIIVSAPGSAVAETKPAAVPAVKPDAAQWPKVVPLTKFAAAPVSVWSKDEVDSAKAKCTALLSGIDAVAIPAEPMRSGNCGTPAPMELISIGRNPQVTFSAPVVVTCDMVRALHDWMKKEVQPAARAVLGGPVVRVELMSGYSCRNAYGRKNNRMSEHGRANAVDLRSFITDKGVTAEVLADWGLTEREARARIAAAEKAQRQMAAVNAQRATASAPAAMPQPPKITIEPAIPQPSLAEVPLRGTLPEPLAAGTISAFSRLVLPNHDIPTPAFGPPSRLGGPKPLPPKLVSYVAGADPKLPKQRFVRMVHATACHVFGTVLGPEANAAHHNHLHLDMADRPTGVFCE